MTKQSLFESIVPILYIADLKAEVAFYEKLGFKISYQGDEFPNFIAVKNGDVEFGLEKKESFNPDEVENSFYWQMEVRSLKEILNICQKETLKFTKPTCYWERMDAWEMTIDTPNGYKFHLEGPNPNK